MEVLGVVLAILIPILVIGGIIAGIVYVINRSRAGAPPISITFRTVILVYLYLVSAITIILIAIGVDFLFRATYSEAFGRDFSYEIFEPGPFGGQTGQELRRRADNEFEDDLLRGATLAIVATLVWGVHRAGRWYLEQGEQNGEASFIRRVHLVVMLLIFGLVGLFSLPFGIYETLRFYIIEPVEFESPNPPGDILAMAVPFTIGWVYYSYAAFNTFLRRRLKAAAPL